jgi:hypothetical protein
MALGSTARGVAASPPSMGFFSSDDDDQAITSLYGGECASCGARFPVGDRIYWNKSTKRTRHVDCEAARLHREREAFANLMDRLENSKGSAGRRSIIEKSEIDIRNPEMRTKLLLEASRLDAESALEKAESLKTDVAKRRRLMEALDAIRADSVSDSLQAEQIKWIEDALTALGVDVATIRPEPTSAPLPSPSTAVSSPVQPTPSVAVEPRKTNIITLALAYAFGSCFWLSLTTAIGRTGMLGAVLGFVGTIASVIAFFALSRARGPVVVTGFGCVWMMLVGFGTTDPTPSRAQRTVVEDRSVDAGVSLDAGTAEGTPQHTPHRTKKKALPPTAQPFRTPDACQ